LRIAFVTSKLCQTTLFQYFIYIHIHEHNFQVTLLTTKQSWFHCEIKTIHWFYMLSQSTGISVLKTHTTTLFHIYSIILVGQSTALWWYWAAGCPVNPINGLIQTWYNGWWCHIQVTCWFHHDNGDLGSRTDRRHFPVMGWCHGTGPSYPDYDWCHHLNSELGSTPWIYGTGSIATHHMPNHATSTHWPYWGVKPQYYKKALFLDHLN